MDEKLDPEKYRMTPDGIAYTTVLPDTGRSRGSVKPYVLVWLREAARAFTAMHCQKAMVYLWLIYKAKVTGERAVKVTNSALEPYGVSRNAKYLALKQLEADGVIRIDQTSRKSPVVTLL